MKVQVLWGVFWLLFMYMHDFIHAGVCMCVRASVHVCWAYRGEGDVMLSLCLANLVVSTPNSWVYGV